MKPTVDAGPPREHPFSNKREMEKVLYMIVVQLYFMRSLIYFFTYSNVISPLLKWIIV